MQQKTIADTWAMLISLPERGLDLMLVLIRCQTIWIQTGANELEHATQLYCCHGVFIDRFIFRSNLLWRRLPWECHNQSQDTNWRHCVTGLGLPFVYKRKGVLKVDQSVKVLWHAPTHRLLEMINHCIDSHIWVFIHGKIFHKTADSKIIWMLNWSNAWK